MRKLFTLLTMCLLASAAWALDIEFVAGVDNGNSPGTAQAFSIEKGGVKIDISNGLANSNQYRIYKSQTATFTSLVGDISKIVFECTAEGDAQYGPGCFTAAAGTYTYEGAIGTWTGAASSVVLTASANQVRCTKIIVTVPDGGLSIPVISPEGGTYYDPITVSITCMTAGAKIYYTTNGSDPTTSSTQYTAPFTVSSNTTVKAIAAKDGDVTAVATAEYVFASATPVPNIKAYQQVADETVVKFTNPVNVLAQNKGYLFVKDDSGYALFYGNCGQTYKNGDVIPAGFVGTKTTYNGEPELKDLVGFQPASGNSPIEPVDISADIVGHPTFGWYVRLENVTISTEDNKNYTLTDEDGNTCAVYFGTMGVSAPSDLTAKYLVEAIVGSYGKDNVVYQLLPTLVHKIGDPGCDGTLASLGDLPDNTVVTMEHDAIVLAQQGSYLYLKDDCGFGLAYGSCGQTYKPGDIIPAGYGGTKTTYDMEPELKTLTGFKPAKGNIGGVEQLEKDARPTRIPEIGHSIWGQYIKLENVFIDTENKVLKDAEGHEIGYYDRFGIPFPEDLTQSYTVYGIVGSFRTNYQVLLTRIVFIPKPVYVGSIEELYAKNEGVVATFTTPLTAIYQNGPNLYVIDQDETYSLVYGFVDGKFKNGDIIEDAAASWTTYNGNKQLKPANGTFNEAVGNNGPVMPVVYPIEEISQDMVHWYIRVNDAYIYKDGDNTMMDDGEAMILFNRFNIEIPEDDETHNIWGFLTLYKNEREFYPISIDKDPDIQILKGDVNGDGEVTIADANIVISIILGQPVKEEYVARADVNEDMEITIADVNEIIKIIVGGN